MTVQIKDVLDFWFGPSASASEIARRQRKLWFGKLPIYDQIVVERFSSTLVSAKAGQLDHWSSTPRGRLALIVVLDQFPHHIHRDQPEAFASDSQALVLSMAALSAREDLQLMPIERVFLYLPLEHAETMEMQDLSVTLYEKLAREATDEDRALFNDFLKYARQHREVVRRFGRFPHRNALLGRVSSPEEIAFLMQPGSRF